jgi:hypothetical protein
MGLSSNPTCRKFGAEEETPVHILCECEALASLRHAYLGSFVLDPEDIRKLITEVIWNKGPALRPRCIGGRARTQITFIHSLCLGPNSLWKNEEENLLY